MYKTIIFDVDGTILDGSKGILNSVNKTINYFNLPKLNNEKLKEFIGPPIQNSCKEIFNADDTFAQEFANYFRQEYSEHDVYMAEIYDGIYSLLGFLKENKYNLGIATYKRQDYAINLMKYFNLDKYFNAICGADNENKLKKIDILKNCIQQLNSINNSTILIGDSIHDANAALNSEQNLLELHMALVSKVLKK